MPLLPPLPPLPPLQVLLLGLTFPPTPLGGAQTYNYNWFKVQFSSLLAVTNQVLVHTITALGTWAVT